MMVAARRTMLLFLFSMANWIVSAYVIMGEDVYWKVNLVDTIYSNIGTSPNDVWNAYALFSLMTIWAVGMFWVIGCFDHLLE